MSPRPKSTGPDFGADYAPEPGAVVLSQVRRTFAAPDRVRTVLDGIDLVASPGSRVGLIGENGAGKSTLLRIVAGLDQPDQGHLQVPTDLVYLPQDPDPNTTGSVGDLLEGALTPMRRAVHELERLADCLADEPDDVDASLRYDQVLAWATLHDAWSADRRALAVASHLGVADLDRNRPLATLSGGQRSRVALAAALVRLPAVLLLDEPTNHLDEDAAGFLERSLLQMPGVVIAASHDRTFLNTVCSELFDLDAGALGNDGHGSRRFGGSYLDYVAHQRQRRLRWEETYVAEQNEIARLRAQARLGTEAIAKNRGPRDNDKFVYHFKGGNVERARARRVRDAQRRLEVAERGQVARPPKLLSFAGDLAQGSGPDLLVRIRGLWVAGDPGHGPRVTVNELDLHRGDHLLVLGPNGSGKSTLLDLVAGRLRPDGGVLEVSTNRVALLTQDPNFPDPGMSAEMHYARALGDERADRVPLRSLGLLPVRDLGRPVGSLSLGQQRRLGFAVAVASEPDLLLLDEPTNHLSVSLAAEIDDAVTASPGTVVVTSHDRWLRANWRGTTFVLDPRPGPGSG